MRDGAYFSWSGTVTNDPARTDYYTSVVSGKNPFISVTPLKSEMPAHPAAGTYSLGNGGPHFKAFVRPEGSDFQFQALGEGSSWNNLVLEFEDLVIEGAGTHRKLTVTDRLSAIKYRTSYFDVALAASLDSAGTVFGERNVQPNASLEADPSLNSALDGVAASPYRPFVAGQITTGLTAVDWVTHLDGILTATGEQLLLDAGKVSHQQAVDKAENEYKKYQQKTLSEVEKSFLDTISQHQ
jgi:hypothetical protein